MLAEGVAKPKGEGAACPWEPLLGTYLGREKQGVLF